MKKTVLAVISCFLSAFLFVSQGAKRQKEPGYPLMMKVYDILSGGGAESDREAAEKMLADTDADVFSKYCVRKVLLDGGDGTGETAQEVLIPALTGGNTLTSESFFDLCRRIAYPVREDISAGAAKEASARETDDSIPELLVCPKLTERYVVSCDGTYWKYSSRYFVSYSGGAPSLIVRSVRGQKEIAGYPDINSLVSSHEIFESTKAYREETVFEENGLRMLRYTDALKGYGSFVSVSEKGYSSPVYFDFSRFNKNQRLSY